MIDLYISDQVNESDRLLKTRSQPKIPNFHNSKLNSMAFMNKIYSEKYIHRDILINRCNDNCIPNLDTSFHLVPLADEINVGGNGVAAPTPPTNKAKNYETRQQR